jgi:HAD superfamily hydrolase (TIGR01509 family)
MFLTMSLPRQARAVIFDMDGLIFDTEALYRDAVIAVASEAGHDIPLNFYLGTIGLSLPATRTAFNEQFGESFIFDEFWTATWRRFQEATRSQLRLKTGVIELLDLLDDLRLPRAIATSSRHEDAAHHLEAHRLAHRFQAVIAHGDYANGKPHPDPFLLAAERLGVAPEFCLALEDSHNGVRAASAAGMMTVMVPDLLAINAEMEALCVCIVRDLHQVRTLVQT